MKKLFFNLLFVFLISSVLFSCKKTESNIDPPKQIEKKKLNDLETEAVARMELASNVLASVFKNKSLRSEFHNFITAKLKKTGYSEELTFKEIFSEQPVQLSGVAPDFFKRFKSSFINITLSGDFPNSSKFNKYQFKTENDIASFYGQNSNNNGLVSDLEELPDPGYEIYFPYSENWGDPSSFYSLAYHPLTNNEENEGGVYDANTGQFLYYSLINDEYAWQNQTYVVTIDDGLNFADFQNGLQIGANTYDFTVFDNNYNPVRIQRVDTVIGPNPSPCTKELRVGQGRWTLLNNGYGLFEGRIELAVAVSNRDPQVTIPNQNPQSNPIISFPKSAHGWGYTPLTRARVRRLINNPTWWADMNVYIGPWCSGQPDKMIFLYEYDKPWLLSQNAKEFSEFFTAVAAALIGDSTTRAAVQALPIVPVVKAVLEGTAQSRIEHYSIIGSNAVTANQRIPTNGMNPTTLNGFRPYGTSGVMVNLIVD